MTIKWGIIATGGIAHKFAKALSQSSKNTLHAVASRSKANADKFASSYGLTSDQAYEGYIDLLEQAGIDAVYIATPHSDHTQWVLAALTRKIAVLCEKPMTMNHAETMLLVDTARRHQTFLMEAFMYRLHPQQEQVDELIASNAIGTVRHLEAQFGYHAPFDRESRIFAAELAGGGILDVGCYPMSFANQLFNHAPIVMSAHGHLGQSGVDEWTAALVSYPDDATAQLTTAVSLNLTNQATIYGTSGKIHLDRPWQANRPENGSARWSFQLIPDRGEIREFSGEAPSVYLIEADHVADCLQAGLLESPRVSWQQSLDLAFSLDQWRQALGLTYPAERTENYQSPLWHSVRGSAKSLSESSIESDITRVHLPGLDVPVAKLVMGCDNQPNMPHAATMWDNYFLRGGNCFDTAHIYGGGRMESLLGHWHQARGIRDEIVIIGKGAHTPANYPAQIEPQLVQSLERLQTEAVDIYFLHRDNPDVPVGEFVESLNEQLDSGRIKKFGGSNWSIARIREANAYAESKGLAGFTALSNNFSLATMVRPLWPGVEIIREEDLSYLEQGTLALFPWSSQARGFFTPWADEVMAQSAAENASITTMQPTVAELRDTWFSEENFARRERAVELANQHNVDLITIALAYVLNQKFLTFALFGPRLLHETSSSVRALALTLSEAEVRYLRYGA